MLCFCYFFLPACTETKLQEDSAVAFVENLEGDGLYSDDDCNDSDANVNPAAPELCGGYDNNCNGQAEENLVAFAILIRSRCGARALHLESVGLSRLLIQTQSRNVIDCSQRLEM